jgi:hypothetical protein
MLLQNVGGVYQVPWHYSPEDYALIKAIVIQSGNVGRG